MPRIARLHCPGQLHHFMFRFADGKPLFSLLPGSREELLDRLHRVQRRTSWVIVSHAFMDTHGHLGGIGDQPPDRLMHPLLSAFAASWNRQMRAQGRRARGPRMAGRYTVKVMDLSAAPRLIAYHHNNPVSAGIVSSPEESTWTSHRMVLGMDPVHPAINARRALDLAGFGGSAEGRRQFHEFVCSRRGASDADLEEVDLAGDRRAVRTALELPAELAGPRETPEGRVYDLVPESVSAVPVMGRPDAAHVVRLAAGQAGLSLAAIRGKGRGGLVTEARTVAVHVWRALGGCYLPVAARLAISVQSAAALARRRPDPLRVQALLESLGY